MKLYAISDWESRFETAETRKLVNLHWWPKPNKHDGLGFRRLADHRDKVDLYCAWALIADVASRSPRPIRGSLQRNGKALTSQDLALMTGFPKLIFDKAFTFFSDPEQGWLIETEVVQHETPGSAAADLAAPTRVEGAPGNEPRGRAVSPELSACPPGTPGDSPDDEKGTKRRKEGTRSEGNARAGVNGHLCPAQHVGGRFLEKLPGKNGKSLKIDFEGACAREAEFEELFQVVLGKDEMARCGSRWRKRSEQNPEKLERVLNELKTMQKEGTTDVRNPGAAAEDLWKRFT